MGGLTHDMRGWVKSSFYASNTPPPHYICNSRIYEPVWKQLYNLHEHSTYIRTDEFLAEVHALSSLKGAANSIFFNLKV